MLAAAAMLAAAGSAWAQPFPSKPVHILVPYAAGGAVDILSRTLGDAVSKQWGQPVVIEKYAPASMETAPARMRYR